MTAYMDHKNLANEVIDGVRAVQIADGVHRVLDRIASAEQHAGRDAGSVRLLAATKTRDVGEIMAAIDAGVRMIGENRPQEVMAKAEGLMARCGERGFALGVADDAGASTIAGEHIPFHLIGQLQSNKIGKVLPVVNTIESVDSLDLAEKISRRAVARGIAVGVLLLSQIRGFLESPVLQPAFDNILPALFGPLAVVYVSKNWKVAMAPLIFMIVLFICVPVLADSVGVLVPVGAIIAIVAARILYKKGLV